MRPWIDRRVDALLFKPQRSTYDASFSHRSQRLVVFEGSVTVNGRSCRIAVPCIFCAASAPDVYFLVIHFHGTEGDIKKSDTWTRLHPQLNAHVLNVEYPGYGIMPAGAISPRDVFFNASEESVLQTAELVFQHVVDLWGWPAQQIVFSGRSLGSGPATWMAKMHPEAAGLVLLSGFASLQDVAVRKARMLPTPLKRFVFRERFGNLRNVENYFGPMLIVHGESDTLITCDHARRLYGAAGGGKSKCVLFLDPSGTHTAVNCASALLQFLNTLPVKAWYRQLRVPAERLAEGGPDHIATHDAEMKAAVSRSRRRPWYSFLKALVVLSTVSITLYMIRRRSTFF